MNDIARMFTEHEVAERLGTSVSTVRRCRNATTIDGAVRPMPGWKNVGSEAKPKYVLPAAALLAYMNSLPTA